MVKLTKQDKELLRGYGPSEGDMKQIARAIRCTEYTVDGTRITADEAVTILGRENFLSGISRSAFHYTASRESEDHSIVSFDSSKLFR